MPPPLPPPPGASAAALPASCAAASVPACCSCAAAALAAADLAIAAVAHSRQTWRQATGEPLGSTTADTAKHDCRHVAQCSDCSVAALPGRQAAMGTAPACSSAARQ